MAKYPIKMLKDEENNPFIPLVSTEGIQSPDGETLEQKLQKKLEKENIIAGSNITISTEGNNITINSTGGSVSANLIDNLTTEVAGQGALDTRQGKILKDSIPQVINNLTTVDTNNALSAYQGYLLDHKFNDYLPKENLANNLTTSVDMVGQYALDAYQGKVLKVSVDGLSKKIQAIEDSQVISSDRSVTDIVTLTREEYQQLIDNEEINETTYYNVLDNAISASTSTPLGGIIFWPSTLDKLQSNFMVLQGQTLSIEDYPELFGIIGTTYGGDGVNTFKLPDASGLTMVGIKESDPDLSKLGSTYGEKTHTLTVAELASHDHTQPWKIYNPAGSGWYMAGILGTDGGGLQTDGWTGNNPKSTGENQPHNNMQPSLLGYWVMKVKEDLYTNNLTNIDKKLENLKSLIPTLIEEAIRNDNEKRYYIGCLVFDTENINPSTYLGFGTWEPWGSGKVPVGVDTSQTEFNSSEKIGGTKTVILQENQLPVLKGTGQFRPYDNASCTGIVRLQSWDESKNFAAPQGSKTENPVYGFEIGFGGGQAHDNLQPYITCYMWKRIA